MCRRMSQIKDSNLDITAKDKDFFFLSILLIYIKTLVSLEL